MSNEKAAPEYTRELVLRKASQLFPPTALNEVIAVLDMYGSESYHHGRELVQLAVLRLCDGSIDLLSEHIDAARSDYRDVLCWGIYPRDSGLSIYESKEAHEEAVKADRRDWLAWLEGDGTEPRIPKPDIAS